MTLYLRNGQILSKNGTLANSEDCCCGGGSCPCDGCEHCPDHCLTIVDLDLEWQNCQSCAYLAFNYPPTTGHDDCNPDPACPRGADCNDGVTNGRNCDWIEECKWRLHGVWNCIQNQAPPGCFPALGFSNCGTVIATLVNNTTWKFEVENGPTNCLDTSCNPDPDCAINSASPDGDVTLNINDVTSFSIATICQTTEEFTFGPSATSNNLAGSSPNGCFSAGSIAWNAQLCCPSTQSSSGTEGTSGSGTSYPSSGGGTGTPTEGFP